MKTSNWIKTDGRSTSYGDLIEQKSSRVFIKNQDGMYIAFNHEDDTMSPEFDFCKDLENWMDENEK